jgi:uncharacterized protein (TIRG00374 family)
VDLATVVRQLAAARIDWVLGVVALSLVCHAVRAQRWRILLRPVVASPFGAALSATLVGFGANMVLPLRLGEIVRPTLFARRVGIPLTPAVASIVVERVLDMLLVVLCFVAVTLSYPKLASYRSVAVVLGAGAASAFAILYGLGRNRRAADAGFERLAQRLPARVQGMVRPLVHGILDGARGLGDARTLAGVLVMSVVLWTLITGTYVLSFLAVDLPVPLVSASLATVVIVGFFAFVPQAPGFIGTWHAACVLSLGLFGVAKDEAVAYAWLTWGIQMVVNVGAGAVALAFQDLSVRQLVVSSPEAKSSPSTTER